MNRKIIVLILSIIGVLLIIGGSTYSALFKVNETEQQSYSTGTLAITSNVTNGSVSLENALPMEDSAGESSTAYTFKITNTGNLTYQFNVKFLSTTTENQIESSYIKIKIDDGDILTLSNLEDGIIKKDVVLEGGKSITFSLRVWLDINTPNTELGKTLNAKVTTEGYAITSQEPVTDPALITLTNLGLDDLLNEGTPDFTAIAETDEGIYAAEDDLGTSYYFRGASERNYVYFAGYYWRIIRINGDGSIRMIYDGTSAHDNGESSTDRYITTSAFNSSYSDNAYVGYMYGTAGASTYAETHANTTDSTIKTYLEDTWYPTLSDDAKSKIVDAIYCNDRSLDTSDSSYTGIGTTYTEYAADQRLYDNKSPVLTCSQENDRFTYDSSNFEIATNGKLEAPVGLITADEVAMAGGKYGTSNSKYYLYIGNYYWTSSPCYFGGSNAYEFFVAASGYIGDNYSVYIIYGVRSVVSLSSEAITGGNGTKTSPFTTS